MFAAVLLGISPAGAEDALTPHKIPAPKNIAKILREGVDEVFLMPHGLFSCKGHPVVAFGLYRDGCQQDVYFLPGKDNGKWGKPQLVLKNAPLGDHSPAVAHNPLNGATFLFYHANPVDLERMGMDRPKGGDAPKGSRRSRHAEDEGEDGMAGYTIGYFVTGGRGIKLSPKPKAVTKSLNGRSGGRSSSARAVCISLALC